MMKALFGLAVVVCWTCLETCAAGELQPLSRRPGTPGGNSETSQSWRAAEVIVKFRQSADPKLRRAFSGGDLPFETLPTIFRELHRTNTIANARPVAHPAWAGRLPADSSLQGTYVFGFTDPRTDIPRICRLLARDKGIEYAEPNYRLSAAFEPDDPFFSSSGSWGQAYDDQWGLKLAQAPAAWDIPDGTNEVLVAVVDSGIDFTHPDLAGVLATNGWNFCNNTGNPADDNGHGTFCSGIIGAVINNGRGIAGLCPEVKLLPLKFLDSTGHGWTDNAASAINYAILHGARVINLSFSGRSSQTLLNAINYAHSSRAVLVASAGNSATNYMEYPAAYRNVITVGATDHEDRLADFSNFGPGLDLAAPGGDSGDPLGGDSIISLRAANTSYGLPLNSLYTRSQGTSFAAPFVSGVVALMRSHHPSLPPEIIRQVLRTTADDIGSPGWDWQTGYGRVNALGAVQVTNALMARIQAPANFEYLTGVVMVTGIAYAASYGVPFAWSTVEWGEGYLPINWTLLASNSAVIYEAPLGSWDTTQVADGEYALRLQAYDTQGNRYEDRLAVNVYNAINNFDPPYHTGWPQDDGGANSSAPVMADLDGDGRKEILCAIRNALVIRNEDGSAFARWPFPNNPRGPPSVADLDGDGRPEIGVIWDDDCQSRCADQIAIWHADGTMAAGWPKPFYARNPFVVRDVSPVFADIDGNGTKEVIWCSASGTNASDTVVHVDRFDGQPLPGWPVTLPAAANRTYTPPAVGDVDGDGFMDIVVLTFSGQVYLLHHDGHLFDGWPVTLPGSGLLGAPALADIDHDGELEVFAETYEGWISCYKASGKQMAGWPQRLSTIPGPAAFADLDGDGRLEIVVGGRVFRADGQLLPGWPPKYTGGGFGDPVIADLDSDGNLDVVSSDERGCLRAWNAAGQELYSLGFPIRVTDGEFGCYSGPLVGDVRGDGRMQVLVFGDSSLGMWDLGTPFVGDHAPWPTMLGDNAHQSRYQVPPRLLSVSPGYAATNEYSPVTIQGDFFLKGMRVLLNNQPQTVLSETVTSITFAVSTGLTPGWYNLSVSNVNSSAAALARAVAVISSAQGDDDGDGLPNGWEIEHGLDPFDNGAIDPRNGAPGDPDGDGATNSQEYSAGTDPRDRNSVFKITGVSLSGVEIVTISWSSAAGRRYSVDRAAQLSGPFVRLTKGVAATPPVTSFSDSNAAPPGPWFYRVVVE